MKTNLKVRKTCDLIITEEFKNFYSSQPPLEIDVDCDVIPPLVVDIENKVIDGIRRLEALIGNGVEETQVIVFPRKGTLLDRIQLNQTRVKTPTDKVAEIKYAFKLHPNRQGKRNSSNQKYNRFKEIAKYIDYNFSGDKTLKKLEEIIKKDTPDDFFLTKIMEDKFKVDPTHEYLTIHKETDINNNYGFYNDLIKNKLSISDANRFVKQMKEIEQKNIEFEIPNKAISLNIDCNEIYKRDDLKCLVDTLFTSPPYYKLRKYLSRMKIQLGLEKTPQEYAENLAQMIKNQLPLLKETSSVFINIGETFVNGRALGMVYIVKEAIERVTGLAFMYTYIWSKGNAKPFNNSTLMPNNNTEYILWFAVNPEKVKRFKIDIYKPIKENESRIGSGAKDRDEYGNTYKASQYVKTDYTKIWNHIVEQNDPEIIYTSNGTNYDVKKIVDESHPAIMHPQLPTIAILSTTEQGDTVYDMFSGTNVVGRLSLLLNRKSLSAEISTKYYEIGCQMLKKGDENFSEEDYNNLMSEVIEPSNEQQAA